MRHLIALALLAIPVASHAQSASIAPGMTRSQVVAAFGEPATMRSASDYTYLFYRNDCGRACGMNDLVVLRGDSVVDAILRASTRRYTGASSSPAPVSRSAARTRPHSPKPMTMPSAPPSRPPAATRPGTLPAASKGTSPMKPGEANDTRPWVPAGEPALRPAPTTAPAPSPAPTRAPAPVRKPPAP